MLSSKIGKRKATNNGIAFLQKIIIMIFRPFFARLLLVATSAEIKVWKTFLWKRYNIDYNGHFRQHFKCSFKASKAGRGNVQHPDHVWPANYLNLTQKCIKIYLRSLLNRSLIRLRPWIPNLNSNVPVGIWVKTSFLQISKFSIYVIFS